MGLQVPHYCPDYSDILDIVLDIADWASNQCPKNCATRPMHSDGQTVTDGYRIDMDVRRVTCDREQYSLMPSCAPFSTSFVCSGTKFLFVSQSGIVRVQFQYVSFWLSNDWSEILSLALVFDIGCMRCADALFPHSHLLYLQKIEKKEKFTKNISF